MERFRYFSKTHERHKFTIDRLIETLDVEEKARAKTYVGRELLVLALRGTMLTSMLLLASLKCTKMTNYH